MAVQLVHRPARSTVPARLAEPVHVEPPPDLVMGGGAGNFMALLPLLGAGASMTAMMLVRRSPLAAIGALMMLVTLLATAALYVSQSGKAARQRSQMRDVYLDYLDGRRTELRAEEGELQRLARQCNPSPAALHSLIRDPHRLWERRRHHEDFLQVRIGQGNLPARQVVAAVQRAANTRPDPFMEREMLALKRRFDVVIDMPVTVDLDSRGNVSVIGDEAFCRQVARALVVQATSLHSPEDLQLAVVCPAAQRDRWRWADPLPHLLDQADPRAWGPTRRVAEDMDQMSAQLGPELRRRVVAGAAQQRQARATNLARLLVVNGSHGQPAVDLRVQDQASTAAGLGVSVVHLLADRRHEPDQVEVRITQTRDGFVVDDYRHDPLRPETTTGRLDEVDESLALGLSRTLSPLRLSPDSLEHANDASVEAFTQMIGLQDYDQAELARLWQPRSPADFLRVVVGTDDAGQPVRLDLKEAAQLGMGPHGLCVGATGSGKSEFLRALVVSLLASHSPEVLNMVLVDFKGGATFAPFDGIPHISGIITNLADDVSLVDRVHASLAGEVQRRQQVLKDAGNISNITDYQLHRAERASRGEHLEPLPHLFVVIDEFGELLTARPDFIELFLSIGRIGRSVGVHLLLSSQRIESGKLRGLETYLSYRIGLRTLSDAESRTVLDTPDAFHLPALPGWGYLKVDTTVYTRFRSGYVSGPLPQAEVARQQADQAPQIVVLPDYPGIEADEAPQDEGVHDPLAGRTTGATVLSSVVDLLRTRPRATEPIWLPPLPDVTTLDLVAGPVTRTTAGPVLSEGGGMVVPIGTLDDPAKQWQGQWFLDLNRAGGNAVISGGPATGKSTALRTIALSLAMTHSPSEVALYGIDLRGSALMALRDLPHAGGMAMRTSREQVRRTVEEVSDILHEREQLFEARGIDSLTTMRRMHADGELPEVAAADVVLFIDGYGALFDEFEEIEHQVHSLLARGGGYGIHVIATATRWNEVRIAQQSAFGNRIELRLAEPGESSFGRKLAESLPLERPGRGLDSSKLIGQLALPRVDGVAEADSLAEGLAAATLELATSVPAHQVRRVRVLPAVLRPDEVQPAPRPGRIALGLRERDLSTRTLDLVGRERHLVVMGDDACGKSNVLRVVAHQLMEQFTSDELVFAVVDPRRGLADLVPDEYLGGYAPNATLAERLTASVAKELAARIPEDGALGAGPKQVPLPRIVLLVDDYDVLTAGRMSPLTDFVPYLPMGGEIGFHVVMARKVQGASRGIYESFNAAVREGGAATFIMDGDRSEGTLVNGVRAQHQPPGRGLFLSGGRPPETIQTVLDPTTDTEEH